VWKAARYSAVSVVGVVLTQVLLLLGHGILGLQADRANVGAVMLTAIPVYLLNRSWVWQREGRSSLRSEVLPFWAFTAAGLVLSTLAVAGVASITDSSVAVSGANIGAFGLLWVAKFLVLDGVVFADPAGERVPGDDEASAPAVPAGTT